MTVAGSPYVFTYTVSSDVCAANSSTVTINILPLPVVSVAANNTICSGDSSAVTFTGTPNATVTYTVNGGAPQTILLNASGTATTAETYTENTVIDLAAISTGGANSCTQTQTGSITITVLPLPVVAISGNTSICTGGSATVVFTGTPNATVSYTVNNGPVQQIVLDGAGNASVTGNYSATTVFSLVSVTSNSTPACSQPQTGTVTITVIPVPTVSISSNTNVCPGGSATVNFSGTPNANVFYSVNGGAQQTIQLNASGAASITTTYQVTTTYTLTGITTSGSTLCSGPASGSITITVLPLPQASVAANTTVCSGQPATVTFTGTPGATVSYTVNGGPVQTILLNASGTATISNTFTATTVYNLLAVASQSTPSCSQPLTGSITITVVPLPTVTISANTTICSGESAVVTFSGTPNATVTYTVNGGPAQSIVLGASGSATVTGTYSTTTVFSLVSATTAGTPGCSQPQSGTVTITVIPPPTASVIGSATICPGGSSPITFSGTPNATISYTVNNGPVQTIVLNGSGTATTNQSYNQTTLITLTGVASNGPVICSQPVSGTVTITVIPPPTVTIAANATICSGESATVTFTGTPNATITYTVNGGPNQTITLNSSGTATVTSIFTSTTTYSLVSASGAGTPSCSQPQSGTITITVVPLPVVTISSSATVCTNQVATVTFSGTPNAVVSYTVNGGVPQTIQLNASGTATIINTYNETTIYQLLSATLSQAPGCSQPQSGSITISVVPVPAAAISGNAVICAGETTTVTFTGTPNSTVSYTVNGGPVQTIFLNDTGTATITTSYSVTTVYELVNVTVSGATSCSAPATGTISITIVPPPVVSISGVSPICSGGSSTITFTGTPNAVVTYTINSGPNQTIVLDASGNATISNTFSTTTTFTLVNAALSGGSTCSQPQTGAVTVNVIPLPTATISSNATICSGTSATVTFSGTPNATVTYNVNGGASQSIVLDSNGNATIATNYTSTTTYNLVNVSSSEVAGCTQPQSGSVTITVVPPPIVSIAATGGSTVCSGQTGSVTFTGTPNSVVTYTINGGANQTIVLDSAGNATLTSTLTVSTTYTLVSATTSGSPACTQLQSGSVTLSVTPIPVAGENVTNHAVCANSGLQDLFLLLGPTAQPGGTWFPVLSNGNGIFDPEVDPEGTYIYTVAGTAPCPNDSASVTVSIIQPPSAGNDATISICSNSNSQDLFNLLGANAQTGGTWSPALASGTGIFDPAVDVSGVYTYSVAGDSPCATDTATVNVTVVPGPDAGQDGTITLCSNSGPQNLFTALNGTPLTGGTWSPTLSGGNGIFNPAVDAPGVYTYTFAGTQPCDNDSANVVVTVNPVPDAGVDGTAFFCTNHPAQDLFTFLSGTPQTGGVWSPALASGTGIFNPLLDAAGIYTYTVGGGFCSTDSATVQVSVTQSPNAGGAGATLLITTCTNIISVDLFTGLNGTQAPGTWADDDATGALNNNIFNPSAVGPGTYHFTYTVEGGISPCTTDSATVTVVVDPQPNAGTFSGSQTVCSSVGTFDLGTLLNASQSGGVWTDGVGTVITNPVNISALSGGTYYFTYTINNACGTDAEIVQLNILPSPAFTNANVTVTSPVCVGSGAVVNFSGMADGSYTINYSLTGGNVSSPQTVLLTITNGSGVLVINPALIQNTGTTTITFNSILNNATGCGATLTNVSVNFIVSALSNLANANITIADACLGSDVVVLISSAAGMPDGNYQFNYTISGATTATGSSGIITMMSGSGQFSVPGALLTTPGAHTLTINNIISISGCSNFNVNASATFTIIAVPNTSGATVTAANGCVGFSNILTISGATAMVDGPYTINYQISGANTATGSATATFTNGNATIEIPATDFPNTGSVTITFTSITTGTTICGASGTVFAPVTFNVTTPATPVLNADGDQFCATENPTIADLTANVTPSASITWYDAPNGGTAYSSTDLLVNGQIYYAAFTESGCESVPRLLVTVDLTVCAELLIPDGFSPNDDNINDEFVIVDLPLLYPNFKLEIYNRYGNILYVGNINTPNWNGTTSEGGIKVGGDVVPTGVYFYILNFNDGERAPIQGRLYLSR
jgi:gliding motility-associated-like protein